MNYEQHLVCCSFTEVHMKYSGYIRRLAWAYVFLLVNVNLELNYGGAFNILPAWVGLLIIYMYWDSLKIKGRKELALVALILNAVCWMLNFLGRFSLLASATGEMLILWINHIVFDSLADSAEELHYTGYAGIFRKIRDAILVFSLLGVISELISYLQIVAIVCALALFVVAIYMCVILFRYSRELREKGD